MRRQKTQMNTAHQPWHAPFDPLLIDHTYRFSDPPALFSDYIREQRPTPGENLLLYDAILYYIICYMCYLYIIGIYIYI